MLKCKPGDLVRFLRVPQWPQLEGRLNVVIKIVYGEVWTLQDPIPLGPFGIFVLHGIADKYLQPIRDQPGEDETLRWAGHPADKAMRDCEKALADRRERVWERWTRG